MISSFERLADALVYSLYFGTSDLEQSISESRTDLSEVVEEPEIVELVENIMDNPIVKELELLGNYPAPRKLRR
jgi:hypothetical protein